MRVHRPGLSEVQTKACLEAVGRTYGYSSLGGSYPLHPDNPLLAQPRKAESALLRSA